MNEVQFILYVSDQQKAKVFYQNVLLIDPCLHVPGMTEFQLSDNTKLGLMPEDGIAKIITPALTHPKMGNGIPRCELYLHVRNVDKYIQRAMDNGAQMIDSLKDRDWGDKVAYLADTDGHVVAFVEK